MLTLPTEAADTSFARRLENGYADNQTADLAVILLALPVGDVNQRRIVNCLNKSIAENTQRGAKRSNRFRIRHALQNLDSGESSVGADGSLVHQRASLDDFGSVVDRNLRVLEFAVPPLVADTQLCDLTDAAGNRTLMALSAGLSIEERTEPIGDDFDMFKIGSVRLVRLIIYDCVALVVEAGRRLKQVWSDFGMRCW